MKVMSAMDRLAPLMSKKDEPRDGRNSRDRTFTGRRYLGRQPIHRAPSAFAHNRQEGANVARTYRPPAGQIYERGFRDARTPEQAERRDFQLDGAYQ
jgi:hypothetical protein